MQIKILYFDGCPSWETAANRVRTVLAELGRADIAVQGEDVHQSSHVSPEWAGSPTVLLDGHDPFREGDGPLADLLERGLEPAAGRDACRMYLTTDGLEPAPSVDQLRTALILALNRDKESIRVEDR
jgi:hypothetical protein